MKQRVSSEKCSLYQGLANSKMNFKSIFKFNGHRLEESELILVVLIPGVEEEERCRERNTKIRKCSMRDRVAPLLQSIVTCISLFKKWFKFVGLKLRNYELK